MFLDFKGENNILKIHQKSRELLGEFGLKVKHENFLKLLAEKGFDIDFKENIVKIPYDIQEKYLQMVPSFHMVSGWDIKNRLEVNSVQETFYPRNATGSIFKLDFKTLKRQPGKARDLIEGTIILENLDCVKIVCGCIYPNDIDPKYRDIFVLKTLLQYCTKYIYMQPYNSTNLRVMVEMLSILKEDITELKDLPLMNVSISSTSPLKFDALDIELLYECCKNDLPVLMCVGPISGLTAPVTLAGGLVVQHAESMAGFIFAQAIKKGSAIVYEPRLTGVDMRTANIAHASMEFLLATIASIKLAGLLGIPVDAGNMICDSKVPDMQAGIEKSTGLFITGQFGPSVISGIGNLEAANSFSVEQAVIDDELLAMFSQLEKGFDVNDATLADNLIREIGYASDYITHNHTLKNHQDAQHVFDIFNRDFGQAWEDKGSRGIVDNANEKVAKILKNNSEPKLGDRLSKKIEKIYRDHIEKS